MKLPINLLHWIDRNRHLLKPPVGNKVIWKDQDFICMIVGGPNSRTDFHIEAGPEFFYQLEGEMVLRLHREHSDGCCSFEDVPIRAGEIYLLAPNIAHSPQRMANSIGLVIERRRLPDELDGLQWFCPKCAHKLYEEFFPLRNIETQFPAVFDQFEAKLAHRSCKHCGTVHPLRDVQA